MSELRIGVSGWNYPEWRGVFLSEVGLIQRRALEHGGQQNELGRDKRQFLPAQSPASYQKGRAEPRRTTFGYFSPPLKARNYAQ